MTRSSPGSPTSPGSASAAGVGRAVGRAFAERGCTVGLLARGPDGLDSAAEEFEAAGGRALAVPTDVADPDQVERAATLIEELHGPVDVWVNNAMTSVFAMFMDVSPDEFRRVTDVTYHGYVNGTRSALRRMLPRDRGTIVRVGSALFGAYDERARFGPRSGRSSSSG